MAAPSSVEVEILGSVKMLVILYETIYVNLKIEQDGVEVMLQTYIWVVPSSAHWPSCQRFFMVFLIPSQQSQVSISIRPCPSPPEYFSVHYSSVILSFNAM